MAEYLVLYNPHSGNGRGSQATEVIKERLTEDTLKFEDITKITDYVAYFKALEPGKKVIITGGDGTLNRFVNDVDCDNIDQDIYYYATGSGNDFLCDLGKTTSDCPILINDYIKNLPIAVIKGKKYKFINGIGYGIDGYCCEVGDRVRAISTKKVDYTSIAIKGLLFHYKPTNAKITIDGVVHNFRKVWLAPTMHGRYYGGGMMATPGQDRLNNKQTCSTLVFYGAGRLHTLMMFPSIFKGEHVKYTKHVLVMKGHEIKVEFDSPTALQVDGETILGVSEYTVYA